MLPKKIECNSFLIILFKRSNFFFHRFLIIGIQITKGAFKWNYNQSINQSSLDSSKNKNVSFTASRHIGCVKQAARNLSDIYNNYGIRKKGTLILSSAMARRPQGGFEEYIKNMSLLEVQKLLSKAETRLKKTLSRQLLFLSTKKDLSSIERIKLIKLNGLVNTSLVSKPKK